MCELPLALPRSAEPLVLDVCGTCQFVWFDPGELSELPAPEAPTVEPEPARDPEVEAALRTLTVKSAVRDDRWFQDLGQTLNSPSFSAGDSSGDLTSVGQFLSFFVPVEEDHPTVHRPVATYALLALVALTSLLAFVNLESAVQTLGFIPAKWSRYAGLSTVTSFFVHAGWLHLLGNAYFFWLTGDNVEDFLGPRRFLVLVALATLSGAVAHGLFDPNPQTPCVGASGGISGLMAFYALRFPRAKLHVRFFVVWVFRLPFWLWFLFWVGLQVLGAFEQAAGLSAISAAAHLGGAAMGVALWGLWRQGRLAL